jgi:hypothetical protein
LVTTSGQEATFGLVPGRPSECLLLPQSGCRSQVRIECWPKVGHSCASWGVRALSTTHPPQSTLSRSFTPGGFGVQVAAAA